MPALKYLCLTLLIALACTPHTSVSVHKTTGICIYGATPGGIAAALAAAQYGENVLLIASGDHLGGLFTSGLSHSDFHSFESLSGTFLEVSKRVEAYYEKTYGVDSPQLAASFEGTFAEPKVNLLVLREMMAAYPNLAIIKEARLNGVDRNGNTIKSASYSSKEGVFNVDAEVFIDATYEGDLMAMAGVPYEVGREGKQKFGESLAPDVGDEELQGYNFRFCATKKVDNRAPVVAPEGYNRTDFLDLIPILESGDIQQVFGYPSKCLFKAHLPPLPNDKYDINDVSNGLVRLSMPGHNLGWPEGDQNQRLDIFQDHLRYNVGLLYFLQNDETVPKNFQKEALEWGWCLDEFEDYGNLPPELYVREARRMQGQYIYTQKDSDYYSENDARALYHADAIAMGDYGNNCHGTRHIGPLIGGKHEGEFYNPVPPYQIPYGVLLPKEVNNLLVPVAVSSSHVGLSALRLEPIWMSLGQAAGHAAGLAVKNKSSVQELNISLLQNMLHKDGSTTIYVSDVLPGDPDFLAVQWWGTQGGLHGMEPKPQSGARGKNIHGQYFEAAPGHELNPAVELTPSIRDRWMKLADKLGIAEESLVKARTRGDFIRKAYAYFLREK
ncbi:MAG TPA: FAD-dependent oxidoreductase [Lunatimonas sp.]|nr:FAD-dependent oxidoreductase [Lunatimonas sp.]